MAAALFLINVRNNLSKSFLNIIFLSGIFLISCNQSTSQKEKNLELEIMDTGKYYIESGEYEKAGIIYEQFIEKFPNHPYVDDAAYRLAYLHVIVDENNPYYDYEKAVIFFEKFIETYPNSRYIMACKNWLRLLTRVEPAQKDPVIIKVKERVDPAIINQLKAEIKALQSENARLNETLNELQRAIER
jgi:tetratricopeptide (TPR) repeat protein